jgi:hypothetical protein
MPVIATGLPLVLIHAVLDHCPSAVVGDEEAVEI